MPNNIKPSEVSEVLLQKLKEVGDSVVEAAMALVTEHDDVGAILLECSDIPPYAYRVQQATGLPVFDFITLINWAHDAVTQTPYYGHF